MAGGVTAAIEAIFLSFLSGQIMSQECKIATTHNWNAFSYQ